MANAWVLTFSEKVKGWVSFKSFVDMQLAISMANNYYTFESKSWKSCINDVVYLTQIHRQKNQLVSFK